MLVLSRPRLCAGLSALVLCSALAGCSAFRPETRYVAQSEHFLRIGAPGDALDRSLRALEARPDYERASVLVREAYPAFVAATGRQIEASTDPAGRQRLYALWSGFNGRIAGLPAPPVAVVDIESERQAESEVLYQRADSLSRTDERADWVEAAGAFRQLQGYRDAPDRYRDVRERATREVAVWVSATPELEGRFGLFYEGVAAGAIQRLQQQRQFSGDALEFVRLTVATEAPAEADRVCQVILSAVSTPAPSERTEDRSFEDQIETRTEGAGGRVETRYQTVRARARQVTRETPTVLDGVLRVGRPGGTEDEAPLRLTGTIRETWVTNVSGDRRAVPERLLDVPSLPPVDDRLASVRRELEAALVQALEPVVLSEIR